MAVQPMQQIESRLNRMFGREAWHKTHSSGWIGDAIYGVNDGLGAIFGIIAGVAGYTANSHIMLISGLFGALASTLSMGAGAWLAKKSEQELRHQELAHELREIKENPAHEREELSLMYQLKGFTESEADAMAERVSRDEQLFLRTMATEELGLDMEEDPRGHWKSAGIGSLSTLVGGLVPLIPFFFIHGVWAMIIAAIVSILAHFAVGGAKSVLTVRSWWVSGLEMTVVGIIVGVVAYGLGWVGEIVLR
ncbi:VIT1/CCC1 transporter family protein [Alicyclobacillus dauci]|uniref:VIT1/CCC1 transporter family protein n=1 Tax=Alicyclobacillus dauci TaxID=1475485 RepID=A0ABY6Z104_9BACL|nr:VIT1/CCC1 transporter family protein [Alicyclobacillus dauci]WAH36399.1 VIT1/CCC1 transporter family protein [Alicyclobacillus dauci]